MTYVFESSYVLRGIYLCVSHVMVVVVISFFTWWVSRLLLVGMWLFMERAAVLIMTEERALKLLLSYTPLLRFTPSMTVNEVEISLFRSNLIRWIKKKHSRTSTNKTVIKVRKRRAIWIELMLGMTTEWALAMSHAPHMVLTVHLLRHIVWLWHPHKARSSKIMLH